ncbi:MAG: hypothetical protein ACYS0I_13010 [Planctomycetota bacterium]|jgi:hypothetical protein
MITQTIDEVIQQLEDIVDWAHSQKGRLGNWPSPEYHVARCRQSSYGVSATCSRDGLPPPKATARRRWQG